MDRIKGIATTNLSDKNTNNKCCFCISMMHIVEEFHGCNHFTCIYQADPGISEHRGAVLVWWNFWDLGIFLRPRIPYAYVVRTMDEKIHMIVNICLLTWGRGGGAPVLVSPLNMFCVHS